MSSPQTVQRHKVFRIHVADTRNIGIRHVSPQRVSPGKNLCTPPNHQLTSEKICSGLDTLVVSHTLLDACFIQMGLFYPNSTAYPSLPAVSFNVALKVRDASVLLDIIAPAGRAAEISSLDGEKERAFALKVTRGRFAS